MSSLHLSPFPQSRMSPSKSFTCALGCIPFHIWDSALSHTFDNLFSIISLFSTYSILVLVLVHLEQHYFLLFLPLSQITATLLIACFLCDEKMCWNVSLHAWPSLYLFFSSMHSDVYFQCITGMVLRSKLWSSHLFSHSFHFSPAQYYWIAWSFMKYYCPLLILQMNMDLIVSSSTFLIFFLSVWSSGSSGTDLVIHALHEISSVATHYPHNKLHGLLQSQ